MEENIAGFEVRLRVQNIQTGRAVNHIFPALSFADPNAAGVLTRMIQDLCKQVKGRDVAHQYAQQEPPSANRITQLERELERYKAAVKQLSFELEMASGNANKIANVTAIRKMALEQAAEFVMDWGIPKDGHDLEELCKQITSLKETRALAIKRAADAMDAMFYKNINGGQL